MTPVLATLFAALPLFNRVGVLEVLAVLGVGLTGLGSVYWKRHGAVSPAQPSTQPDTENTQTNRSAPHTDGGAEQPLKQLLSTVLPVWLHHVESVKNQTEEAITKLVISFSSINKQFEAAGFVGASGSAAAEDNSTISLLTLCERQLRPVVASMNDILDGKQTLVHSVNDLASATQELGEMATDVSLIAAHTNILAINAAIEAAHAGDSGRGFGVIAKEIRALSQTSAESGKRIAQRMAQVEQIMKSAVESAERASESDKAAIELSGSVIQDVLAHVRELGNKSEVMREQGNIIRADTENLLVNLQFQDRVSQIMGVIDQDINRMHRVVDGEEAVLPSPQEWLDELGNHYTMDDQRHVGAAETAAASASVSDEP